MYELPHPPETSNYLIEKKANSLFRKYLSIVGADHIAQHGLSFDKYYDTIIYPEYEIELDKTQELGWDDDGSQILGRFLPYENIAQINRNLEENSDPRLAFTLYHEVAGHGIFHGEYLRRTGNKYTDLNTTATSIMKDSSLLFEWQANAFAANMAAPKSFIWFLWKREFGMDHLIPYCGPGYYWLTYRSFSEKVFVQSVNNLARNIARRIKAWFGGLSTEALSYQVEKTVIRQVRSDAVQLMENEGPCRIGELAGQARL